MWQFWPCVGSMHAQRALWTMTANDIQTHWGVCPCPAYIRGTPHTAPYKSAAVAARPKCAWPSSAWPWWAVYLQMLWTVKCFHQKSFNYCSKLQRPFGKDNSMTAGLARGRHSLEPRRTTDVMAETRPVHSIVGEEICLKAQALNWNSNQGSRRTTSWKACTSDVSMWPLKNDKLSHRKTYVWKRALKISNKDVTPEWSQNQFIGNIIALTNHKNLVTTQVPHE